MTKQIKFPAWAPEMLRESLANGEYDHDPTIVQLMTRLLTYPEMELVWSRAKIWMVKESKIVKILEALPKEVAESWATRELVGIAYESVAKTHKAAVTPPTKREEALARIAKQSKLLKQSLEALGMPDNILWYFPWSSVLQVFQNATLYIYEDATEQTSFADDSRFNGALDKFIGYATQELALSVEEKTAFSFRELLSILADEVKMDRLLAPNIVQRAKFGNEQRLLVIRNCAALVKDRCRRNPADEREFISNFARTVLDDSEINEDIVKDALRGYEI